MHSIPNRLRQSLLLLSLSVYCISPATAQFTADARRNVVALDLTNTLLFRPELQYERVFRGNRRRPFSLQARLGYAIGLTPREGGRSFAIRNYLDDQYPLFITNGFICGLGWMKFFSDKGAQSKPYGRYLGARIGTKLLHYKDAPVVVDDVRHPGEYFTNRIQDQERKSVFVEFTIGSRQMIGRRTFLDLYLTVGVGNETVKTTVTRDLSVSGPFTPYTETTIKPAAPFSIGLRLGTDW